MAERLPGSCPPPPGQCGYCRLLMRFHAPVHHNDFREMLPAALTQLDGPIPKEPGALYCEEASYRRLGIQLVFKVICTFITVKSISVSSCLYSM